MYVVLIIDVFHMFKRTDVNEFPLLQQEEEYTEAEPQVTDSHAVDGVFASPTQPFLVHTFSTTVSAQRNAVF